MNSLETKPNDAAAREIILKHAGTMKQLEFWFSDRKYRAFVGGVGSGKTRAGVVDVLLQPPGAPGMIVAPTYKMLADPTMETFMEVAGHLIIPGTHNKTDRHFRLYDGSLQGKKVLYRSADEPETLRGPNLGWFWADEAAMMAEMAWKILIGRLRRAPARGSITTTPKGFDWIWEKFENQEDVEDPENYHLIRCSSDHNDFLPDGYVEALAAEYSGGFLAQEIGGEFTEWGKQPVYQFSRKLNVVRDLWDQVYRRDAPLVVAVDFNYLIKPWPIVQTVNGEDYVIDEIVMRGAHTQDVIEEVLNRYVGHGAEFIMCGDASGRSKSPQTAQSDYKIITAELEARKLRYRMWVPAGNPPIRDRINSLNRVLTGDVRFGIAPLKIDERRCPHLLKDLVSCQWNKTGTDVEKETDPEKKEAEWTHATDALGYWAHRVHPWSSADVRRRAAAAAKRRPLSELQQRVAGDMR